MGDPETLVGVESFYRDGGTEVLLEQGVVGLEEEVRGEGVSLLGRTMTDEFELGEHRLPEVGPYDFVEVTVVEVEDKPRVFCRGKQVGEEELFVEGGGDSASRMEYW